MPTYGYECKACGRSMDIFQRMTEDPLKKCPECGADALERQIGMGAGIIFKGSGFYETDYKRKDSGVGSRKESKTSTGSSSSPKGSSSGGVKASDSKKSDVKGAD